MSSSCRRRFGWRSPVWKLRHISPLAAGTLLLAGCVDRPAAQLPSPSAATRSVAAVGDDGVTDGAAAAPTTYILATGTVFYDGDPQHGHKPDGTLRRGTKVTLVHRAGNYSLVRSEDGIEGYVPTHLLEPLAMQ